MQWCAKRKAQPETRRMDKIERAARLQTSPFEPASRSEHDTVTKEEATATFSATEAA